MKYNPSVQKHATEKYDTQVGRELGMSYRLACHRLERVIIFEQSKLLGTNKCVRCGLEIASYQDMSVDHIKHWFRVDKDLFWDFSNIGFSHNSCNMLYKRNKNGKMMMPREFVDGKWKCTKCNIFKPPEDYYKSSSRKNGLSYWCKDCQKLRSKQRYANSV